MKEIYYYAILATLLIAINPACEKSTPSRNSPPSNPTIDTLGGAPPHQAVDWTTTPILKWQCTDPDGDPLVFDVFFSEDSLPAQVCSAQIDMSYLPDSLGYELTYHWQIVAHDNHSHTICSKVWSFTTAVLPDMTPPTVTSTSPADGAVYVHPGIAIIATFSEAIKPETVNDSNFVIGDLSATISYNDCIATFVPDSTMTLGQTYFATITTGIKDLAGNALAKNYAWQFTTAEVMLVDGAEYFPFTEGDIWYYRDTTIQDTTIWTVVREVAGDTTIVGRQCKRISHDGETAEAWSIDTLGFYFHLLTDDYHYWFEPPLAIPFDLAQEEPYNYSSTAFWIDSVGQGWEAPISGTLKFKGYTTYDTPTGIHFDDVIRFFYIPDGYSEYYARGVGLLDNERYILDSAYVGGIWYR